MRPYRLNRIAAEASAGRLTTLLKTTTTKQQTREINTKNIRVTARNYSKLRVNTRKFLLLISVKFNISHKDFLIKG
jgi:hypothetical protein